MKKDFMQTAVITSNAQIAKSTYEMKFDCDATTITAPGQFINIDVPGYFLRCGRQNTHHHLQGGRTGNACDVADERGHAA